MDTGFFPTYLPFSAFVSRTPESLTKTTDNPVLSNPPGNFQSSSQSLNSIWFPLLLKTFSFLTSVTLKHASLALASPCIRSWVSPFRCLRASQTYCVSSRTLVPVLSFLISARDLFPPSCSDKKSSPPFYFICFNTSHSTSQQLLSVLPPKCNPNHLIISMARNLVQQIVLSSGHPFSPTCLHTANVIFSKCKSDGVIPLS